MRAGEKVVHLANKRECLQALGNSFLAETTDLFPLLFGPSDLSLTDLRVQTFTEYANVYVRVCACACVCACVRVCLHEETRLILTSCVRK